MNSSMLPLIPNHDVAERLALIPNVIVKISLSAMPHCRGCPCLPSRLFKANIPRDVTRTTNETEYKHMTAKSCLFTS